MRTLRSPQRAEAVLPGVALAMALRSDPTDTTGGASVGGSILTGAISPFPSSELRQRRIELLMVEI
ncbi:MAG TPA: hypothetical protein VGC82_17845, partial [Rhodopila sp.]